IQVLVYRTRPRKASETEETGLACACRSPLPPDPSRYTWAGPLPACPPFPGALAGIPSPQRCVSLPGGDLGEKLPEQAILIFEQGSQPGPGVLGDPLDSAEVVRGHAKLPVGEGGLGHQRPDPGVLHHILLEGELLVEDGDLGSQSRDLTGEGEEASLEIPGHGRRKGRGWSVGGPWGPRKQGDPVPGAGLEPAR